MLFPINHILHTVSNISDSKSKAEKKYIGIMDLDSSHHCNTVEHSAVSFRSPIFYWRFSLRNLLFHLKERHGQQSLNFFFVFTGVDTNLPL